MMKQNTFPIIFSIFAILVFGILTDYISAQRNMEDKDKLEKSILENRDFASAQYTFPLYSKDEVDAMVKHAEKSFENISEELTIKHLAEYKKVLEKQQKANQYFYMKKMNIEYFISMKDDVAEPYCRLAVVNNSVLAKAFKYIRIYPPKSQQEHSINKQICNNLFGFGKAKL